MFNEVPTITQNPPVSDSTVRHQSVLDQLSDIINDYLEANPRVSLNGLSKRCQVSEPTIRRIAKKQVKTVPTVSTILDLLTTIDRNKNVKEVINNHSGPVADLVREALPHIDEQEPEYSQALNDQLKDPVKYLIYKLSLNHMGVSRERVKKMFGDHGVRELDALVQLEVISKKGNRYFSSCRNHTGSFENFVEHFRACASFIKPEKVVERLPLNPLFVNASESVSVETYREIAKVQRAAFKKISQLIKSDAEKGPIPLLYLCALDTLDTESALEIANRNDSPL